MPDSLKDRRKEYEERLGERERAQAVGALGTAALSGLWNYGLNKYREHQLGGCSRRCTPTSRKV